MNKFMFQSFLVCVLSLLPVVSQAEFETFTNDAGQSIEAELIELNKAGNEITMKLRNGSRIDADLSAFSSKDRTRIRDWWKGVQSAKELLQPESRIEISATMNRKSKKNYDYYYADDKTKSYFPEILIRNDELTAFKDNTVRVVVIAKDLRYEDQKLIVSASTIKSDFADRGDTVLESDPFRLRLYEYDSIYSDSYAYGYEYEGYVVVVKNSKGVITHTRSSKSKYLNDMKAMMECKAGDMYDEDFKHKLSTSPSSYFVR
ncbi:MAG: hypothetical protein ACSHX8_00415 [Opitutaceae bacterium]